MTEPQVAGRPTGLADRAPVRLARELGRAAAPYVEEHDRDHSFVSEAYAAARALRYGAMAVPADLGGDGADIAAVCRAQRTLGRSCASTALALSMHHHTVLTLAWQRRRGLGDYDAFLRRLAVEPLLLSSSGTLDPAAPSLVYSEVDGGVTVSGSKRLSSGSPGSDLLFSLGGDDSEQWIANLAIPLDADGVTVADDWYAMGMRGSGSNSVVCENVFVPAENVFHVRPRPRRPDQPAIRPVVRPAVRGPDAGGAGAGGGGVNGGGNGGGRGAGRRGVAGVRMPGLMIALPVIAAAYLGVADEVADQAIEVLRTGRKANDPTVHGLVGELHSHHRSASLALRGMLDEVSDERLGGEVLFRTVMTCKRQLVTASIRVAELAMEALGSASYLQGSPFERSLRDLRAAVTHPLTPAATLTEVGRSLLQHER